MVRIAITIQTCGFLARIGRDGEKLAAAKATVTRKTYRFIYNTQYTKYLPDVQLVNQYDVHGTIDINLNELEYLAARLNPFECRRLIAALHYTTYELPNTLAAAERNVDDDIPCIRHLLHWNSSPAEGRGKSHEVLTHRLRQINRNDLADWLGKSTFKQLGKDLDRTVVQGFDDLGKEETELPYPVTLEPKRYEEEDPWAQVDVILVAILLGLLGTLLTLICAMIVHRIGQHFRKTKYKKLKKQQERENEEQEVNEKRIKKKYTTESSSEATDYVYLDSTDTDVD